MSTEVSWRSDLNRNLVFVVVAVVTGTALAPGFAIGMLNQLVLFIWNFYDATYARRHGGRPFTKHAVDGLYQFTTICPILSGMLGALLVGHLADRICRMHAILVSQAFSVAGVVAGAVCVVADSPELLIVGRLILGIQVGMGLCLMPIVITETAPTRIRGLLQGFGQAGISFSVLVATILGLPQVLGRPVNWPLINLFICVAVVVSFAILPFVPETPRHLLLQQRRRRRASVVPGVVDGAIDGDGGDNLDDVRRSLQFYRRRDDVDEELMEMVDAQLKVEVASGRQDFTVSALFKDAKLRRPLVVACVLQVCIFL